jgi:hypothetical protein
MYGAGQLASEGDPLCPTTLPNAFGTGLSDSPPRWVPIFCVWTEATNAPSVMRDTLIGGHVLIGRRPSSAIYRSVHHRYWPGAAVAGWPVSAHLRRVPAHSRASLRNLAPSRLIRICRDYCPMRPRLTERMDRRRRLATVSGCGSSLQYLSRLPACAAAAEETVFSRTRLRWEPTSSQSRRACGMHPAPSLTRAIRMTAPIFTRAVSSRPRRVRFPRTWQSCWSRCMATVPCFGRARSAMTPDSCEMAICTRLPQRAGSSHCRQREHRSRFGLF